MERIIKVACVGDSITKGMGKKHPQSYPNQLGKSLGPRYEVINFGIGSRTVLSKGDFPYTNEKDFKKAKKYSPDILIIMLGTNDTKSFNWQYGSEFEHDFRSIIMDLKSSMSENGRIFFMIPPPIFKEVWSMSDSILVNEISPIINQVAQENKSMVIDLHQHFLGKNSLFPDGVHPNEEGLSEIASYVIKFLQNT